MQFVRHGYPTCHRALSLYPSRNIVNKISQADGCISVQHLSSKGKGKALDPDSDHQVGPSTDPHVMGSSDVKDRKCSNCTAPLIPDRGPSELRLHSSFISTKEQKIRRRKRWRREDSYPRLAELIRGTFYIKYLSGPRLPPRTERTTEVIVPEYAKVAIASRLSGAGSTVSNADNNAAVVESRTGHSKPPHKAPWSSKKLSRNRPRSPKSSPIVPVPLPVTHGYGDVEQRVDRCRQAIQQRERNTQGVLEGLSGKLGEDCEDNRHAEIHRRAMSDNTSQPGPTTHPPTSAIQSRVGRNVHLKSSSREYSTYTRSVRQRRRAAFPTSLLRPLPPTMHDKSASKENNAPRTDSSNIDGFNKTWKGEEWKGEDWKDAWGNNDPPVLGVPSTSSMDLEHWLSRLRSRKRPARFSNKKFLSLTGLHHSGLSANESGERKDGVKDLPCDKPDKLSYPSDQNDLLAERSEIPQDRVTVEKEILDQRQTGLSELLLQDNPASRHTMLGSQFDDLLAATRIIAKAGEIAPRARSVRSASKTQVQDNPRLSDFVAIPSEEKRILPLPKRPAHSKAKSEVIRNSRRRLKAAVSAIKLKAKHEFLSQKLSGKSLLHDRKTVKAERKQKKLAALKDVVSGTLKPLAPGEQVLVDIPAPSAQRPVSRLAHGLDRALFSQTVQWLQDPHSRVFNFPPNLQHLPLVTDFAFERLPRYLKSSMDEDLHTLALRHKKQFSGSTSSLTSLFAHIYFLVSGDRPVDISTLSMAFVNEPRSFTPGLRSPATFTLHHRRHTLDVNEGTVEHLGPTDRNCYFHLDQLSDDTHTLPDPSEAGSGQVDSDLPNPPESPESLEASPLLERLGRMLGHQEGKSLPVPGNNLLEPKAIRDGFNHATDPVPDAHQHFDTYAIDGGSDNSDGRREAEQNVLLWLGTMTEKFLTLSEEEFSYLLRKNDSREKISEEKKEVYRYSKSSNFVMRSQLDCQDSRLPGTGIFDIKTRAVLPIRIDQLNFQANSGYLIRKLTGRLESFEREYYDLIRGAFLKYNFQARIGAMDGVFIAYHNTARMFGFQYVPVAEMEQRLYGPGPPERGERVFEKCVGLMEVLVAQIVDCFPGQSLSCTVDAREGADNLMVWVVPLDGPLEDRPMAEFTVTVSHCIDGHPVSSQTAIDQAYANWALNYKVTRSRRPASKVLKSLKATQARRFKQILPEGVSEEEMTARLESVNWGAGLGLDLQPDEPPTAPGEPVPGEAAPSKFSNPNKYLKQLRRLALEGKADTTREEATAAHPIVWGRDPDIIVASDSQVGREQQFIFCPELDGDDVDDVELPRVIPVITVSGEELAHYLYLQDSDDSVDAVMDPANFGSDHSDPRENVETAGMLSVDEQWRALLTGSTHDSDKISQQLTPKPPSATIEQMTKIHDTFSKYHL